MPNLLRDRGTGSRVTNGELFFDLVYVFAITQISRLQLAHPTLRGALDCALLLAMIWGVWAYTTWVTNWLDPDRAPTRAMLMLVMLASLVMSAGLPEAFSSRGLWVGGAYAVMQLGRSGYAIWALQADASLRRNFVRIFVWCVGSGGLALAGGFVHGAPRELMWVGAVAVDAIGGALGFWTPRLGRTPSDEWTIDGRHFAERCQAFLLIALGESVVDTGASFAEHEQLDLVQVVAFVLAFAGAVGLWWLYFDRSAEQGIAAISATADPGLLASRAYHFVHPMMIGGIILTAAGDERVVTEPTAHATHGTAWFVGVGAALFVLGHALYARQVRAAPPVPQLAAFVAFAVLAVVGSALPNYLLGAVALAILVGTVVADRRITTP